MFQMRGRVRFCTFFSLLLAIELLNIESNIESRFSFFFAWQQLIYLFYAEDGKANCVIYPPYFHFVFIHRIYLPMLDMGIDR